MIKNMIKTPCFVLNVDKALCNIIGFKTALINRFKNNILGYSVKTNSFPGWLDIVKDNGGYAEVVSYDEYELVKLCGFDQRHIIYNGPMKSKETFLDAVMNGAIVNIETKRELLWLQELPQDRIFRVGIRLNINISRISPEDAEGDNDNSRFGFSDDTMEFADAIGLIKSLSNVVRIVNHFSHIKI
jgi:diaminopimelate decarboxylase